MYGRLYPAAFSKPKSPLAAAIGRVLLPAGYETCCHELYRGAAAQFSFSVRFRHCGVAGFSTRRTSCGLRRTTTLSPAARSTDSCPSQKSVVPGFTLDATTTREFCELTTTGRNESVCGQIGVTHRPSTPGSTIGPPAERL